MEFFIKTERLILRDPREEDEDILVRQFTDPDVKNKILPYQADEHYQRKFHKAAIAVAKQIPRTYYALSITLRDEETLVGSCTLHNVYPQSENAHLGWHLGRCHWGKGYAAEVARTLFTIGFELNKVNCISAECFANNRAAQRALEKSGMKLYNNSFISQWFRAFGYKINTPVAKYRIRREEYFS